MSIDSNNGGAHKFATDVIWVGVSQVFITLLGIVTLPALTKAYGSETYGIWSQMNVTVGLLASVLTLQFNTAVIRFIAAEEDKATRRRYFGSMLWPIVTFGILVLIAALVITQPLSNFIFDTPEHTYFVLLTFLWVCLTALFNFAVSYPRARGKIKILAILQASLSMANMVAIVCLTSAGIKFIWIAIFLVALQGIFTLGILGAIIGAIGFPPPNRSGLSTFLAFSVPQIPSSILMWIIAASDRYFITNLLSIRDTGIYSSSYSLAGLIALFYSPIAFVLFPFLAKYWEQHETERVKLYLEYSNKLFYVFAIPGAVGLSMLSQPLLRILTTPEFLAGGWLVLLLALGIIFLGIYQINVYIILLIKKTKWLPLMIVAAAITNAVINVVLIPRIGINGAAIAAIVSYFILAAIVTLWARKVVRYRIDLIFLAKIVFATALMAVCIYFLNVERALYIVLAVIVGVVVYGSALFLMRAFSKDDKNIAKDILGGIFHRI